MVDSVSNSVEPAVKRTIPQCNYFLFPGSLIISSGGSERIIFPAFEIPVKFYFPEIIYEQVKVKRNTGVFAVRLPSWSRRQKGPFLDMQLLTSMVFVKNCFSFAELSTVKTM